jgi:iron(III) transport system permease protein
LRLGRWQWVAQIACGVVVLFSLVAPVGVIAYWLVNGLQQGEELDTILLPLQNSMRVAGATALIAGIVGLPLVVLQVRFPSTLSRWLQIWANLGFALPGVVVAISLVFFATRYAGSLYQTFPLLIFAYLVRYLPQLLGPVRASLLQVSPQLEESALTLGKPRWRVTLDITLPLIRNGWVAGVALVFLTTMKELPATLILSPLGFSTLATEIWAANSEAFYARAALPALVLILVSALSLIYILEPEQN